MFERPVWLFAYVLKSVYTYSFVLDKITGACYNFYYKSTIYYI